MGIWHSVTGRVKLKIVSADNSAFLSELHRRNIPIEKVEYTDELTLSFQIQRQDLKKVLRLADSKGVESNVCGKSGLIWSLLSIKKRPILLAGLSFLIFLNLFLPTRILFYRVEGNKLIAKREIVALASQNGLEFGSLRRNVRSEKIKNAMLKEIPQLEWVGINTSGCVATISVRERQSTKDTLETSPVSNMVAARDGVIQEIVVTQGNAVVQPGQEVKAGQILISGYTDCGLSVRAQQAKGEIYAQTSYSLTLVLPEGSWENGEVSSKSEKISLLFGKNRINFSESSGILDTECVKMYEENYVTLPGGFILPAGIVTEKKIYYNSIPTTTSAETCLTACADRYLQSQMVAGSILSREETISQENGLWILEGKYICLEMIGRERSEEIIIP